MLYLGKKRKGFDTLVALTTREVWKERNARVFRDSSSSTEQLFQRVKAATQLWIEVGEKYLGCLACE
jgi:hypothetical protein